jgi:hypothetical protein
MHFGENGDAYANPVTTMDELKAAGVNMFRDNYNPANDAALDPAVEEAAKDGITPLIIVQSPSQLQQAAQHYQSLGVTNIDYEYQNEPNTAYDQNDSNWATNATSVAASYATQAVQAQKDLAAINPNSELIMGAVSTAGIGWAPADTFTTDLAQDLKNDGWNPNNSAISIHPYGGEQQGAAATAADIQTLHNQINNIIGQPVTLDISEVGTNPGDAATYLPDLINDVSKQQNIGMFDVYQWAGQASNNDPTFQIEGTAAQQPVDQALANFASS